MMQRAGNFEADAKLDRIYENMRAEYKYSIRLEDLADLADPGHGVRGDPQRGSMWETDRQKERKRS